MTRSFAPFITSPHVADDTARHATPRLTGVDVAKFNDYNGLEVLGNMIKMDFRHSEIEGD
jgi:hypothetical protein